MSINSEKEDCFFRAVITETPVEIAVRTCALDLAHLHYASTANQREGTIPENDEQSVARHFNDLVKDLHHFKRELLALGYAQVPERLFVKLGPAVEWSLKDVRRYLELKGDPCHDPIEEVREAFQQVKDICRSESQPDGITDGSFREQVEVRMDAFINTTRHLGKVTRCVEERRVIEREQREGCLKTRGHFLANGKGVSHFDRLGIEYKGVKVVDPTHLVLFNRVSLEITSQGSWNLIDRILKSHFNDQPFELKKMDIAILTTSDERRLLKFIHRETLEEAGRHRLGNSRYTGLAHFENNPQG